MLDIIVMGSGNNFHCGQAHFPNRDILLVLNTWLHHIGPTSVDRSEGSIVVPFVFLQTCSRIRFSIITLFQELGRCLPCWVRKQSQESPGGV